MRIPLILVPSLLSLIPVLPVTAGLAQYWREHPVSAEAFYRELIDNPNLEKNNNGEPFAWHSAGGGGFVEGYRIWGGTEWLDFGARYYDFLLDHMVVAPDGYKGLLGRNFRHEFWSDEEVSDALVMNQLLPFAELVLKDPELAESYGETARRYVEHARKHVVEKWDSRGMWVEIGEYGDYIFDRRFVNPEDPTRWVVDYEKGSGGMSQKFNIANKLGLTNIYLYRITGDEFYRDKAEKLFYRMKSNFQLIDDYYNWHYWIPFYPGDIFFEENRLIHWSAVHPFRPGYQATEVHQIAEAYHNGIVFTETDMQRIINTNLKVMWNGDMDKPEFINSNGVKPEKTAAAEAFHQTHSGSGSSNRGVLWSGLIDFDPTIRTLYERGLQNPKTNGGKIAAAYYYTQVKPHAPSFERHYGEELPVRERDVPFGDSRELVIATVIPHIIPVGENSVILTKSIASGPLKIDLCDQYGDRVIRNLYDGDIEGDDDGQKGFRMVRWDGTDPEGAVEFEGEYLIRWSFGDGYRDCAVRVVPR